MKIAIFTDTYLPQMNGVVAYLTDAIRLLRKDNDVVLFAPHDGKFRIDEPSKGLRICWIPSTPFPFYEGYRIASVNYKRVSELLKKERPDIVHAHAPVVLGMQGIIAAKRKKIPVVATYHTHLPDYLPHLLSGKLPAALNDISGYTVKKLIKHAFRSTDVVTAPSHELVRELRSYGLGNVVYLPNGVDLKRFRKNKDSEKEFRELYGIPKNKKVVLYLGRISFEKKLDKLLEAFRRIEKKDRLLLVVGGGPYLEQFREFAGALGIKNAIFTGFVKKRHLAAAYGCADIFASASDSETFGLTFVEAMHMGLPVVGVRRFGAKELIDDEKTGLLVEPDDEKGLADAMERLLGSRTLCKRMGKNAEESAKDYSLRKSIRMTMEIYDELIGGLGRST
jgi:glycosyltransferase involved in cell wall biosynthesis